MFTVYTVSDSHLPGEMVSLTAVAKQSDRGPYLSLLGGSMRHRWEMKDRVRAALRNSGWRRDELEVEVRIGLPESPAPEAAAVAVAVLAATETVVAERLDGLFVCGEVSLDGSLRPTRGVVAAVELARDSGMRRALVPLKSLQEAALVDGIEVIGAPTFGEVSAWLRGEFESLVRPGPQAEPVALKRSPVQRRLAEPVMRAVELAAAGGHHLLLDCVDPFGCHLSAEWLYGLLPELSAKQQMEVATIRSLRGVYEAGPLLLSTPPLATVQASERYAAIFGGETPGYVSRAHHGLLVACDLDDFEPQVLEALAFPLQKRRIELTMRSRTVEYPAGFQLFASSTRAPGGRRPRLPHHLVGAIGIRVQVGEGEQVLGSRIRDEERALTEQQQAQGRVLAARERAAARWGTEVTNAAVAVELLRSVPLGNEAHAPVVSALEFGSLTRKGAEKTLRLAWTAADLDGAAAPTRRHVEEALELR